METDLLESWNIGGRKGHQELNELRGQPGTEDSRDEGEGKALDEQQPSDPRVARAKSARSSEMDGWEFQNGEIY